MRQVRKLAAVAIAVVALGAGQLAAWTAAEATSDAISEDEFGAGVRLDRQGETGKVGFIGTRPGKPIDSGFGAGAAASTVARSFLSAHADALGLRASDTSLRVIEQHATPGGGTAVRLGQSFAGVPVLGGEFVVNLDAGNDVLSVLGEASPITKTSTTPAVSSAAAEKTAVAAVAKEKKLKPSGLAASAAPELMLYDPRLLSAPGPFQTARLAWVTDVRGTGRVTDIGERVVVDAALGTVALSFETIHDAKNRVVCDANEVPAADYPCVAPDRTEASPPVPADDDDMELAFQYAGDTYDFYFTRFGRDSLDGAGLTLVSTTDYCPSPAPDDCPYENAFWDGAQMVYGNGFASADDVVGHELSHGVTDFSSHLFYYQQSGAINESMSDVFGEYIDLTNTGGNDTAGVRWLMGEDIPIIGAIRDMEDPPAFGDPDRMLSPNYTSDPGEGDGGGVHSNSGVNNKAAFLMADGGSFNGQTITGLGITKAARIYYTVNNSMLVSGSDYADLANALRQACTNLIGTDGITAADCVEVNEIVVATEMDQNPTNSPTRSATLCPSGSPLSTVFADNLETPSGQYTTGAISGLNAWSYPQNPNPLSAQGFDATYATSGDTNAWGYNRPTISDSFIRTTNPVAVPANAYLHFNHSYGFEDDAFGAYDGGVVEYSTSGAAGPWTDAGSLFAGPGGANGYTGTIATFDNPLGGRSAFVREGNGYGSSRANLASLAGQNVMFRWRIGSDSSFDDYGWFLDDISVYTCAAAVTPTPTPTPQPSSATGLKAKGKVEKAVVKWQPPTTNAAQVTGYRVSTTGKTMTVAASAHKATVTGLKQGKTYEFTVVALGSSGFVSPASTVKAKGTKVTLKVDKANGKTSLAGKLLKGSKGLKNQVLKVLTKKGNKWVKVDTVSTDKDGKYSVLLKGTSTRPYRVLFKGALALMGSQSPKRHL